MLELPQLFAAQTVGDVPHVVDELTAERELALQARALTGKPLHDRSR